jgi:hypothetical protein
MAYTPPSIDVFSTDDMRQLTNYLTDTGIGISDFIANQAVAMHPRIAETLRAEGIDGHTRDFGALGWGSVANQSATRVVQPLKKAAEHYDAAAKLSRAAWNAWHKYLVTPVEVARRSQHTGRQQMKV